MATRSADQSAPARRWIAITPDDDVDIPAGCCGLFVTSTGDVTIAGSDGSSLTFTLTDAGRILPLGPTRVLSTGTTATDIIGLY